MAELRHAARRLLRATYAPIRRQARPKESTRGRRAAAKRAITASLGVTKAEVRALEQHAAVTGADENATELRAALWAVRTLVDEDGSDGLESAAAFADVEVDALVELAGALEEIRERELTELRAAHQEIREAYRQHQGGARAGGAGGGRAEVPSRAKSAGRTADGAEILMWEEEVDSETLEPEPPQRDARGRAMSSGGGTHVLRAARRASGDDDETIVGGEAALGTRELLDWAVGAGVQSGYAQYSIALTNAAYGHEAAAPFAEIERLAESKLGLVPNAKLAYHQLTQVEPVGFLHLERLSFIPAGIERGELVYSIPLSPGEEVNVTHREWANTSEEFSKIVTDYLEAYSEEGVTEKSELTEATSAQDQHSTGFNTGVTASGGYGPVSITATAGFSVSSSDASSQQSARNHSVALTRKASSRTKKEHKMSFRIASAAGTEDQTVRRVRNPFPDRPTRVDYYQLIRKWRIDLHRYGIRLTYDLTIPEPGAEILSRIQEIRTLEKTLAKGFKFDLLPMEITRDTYMGLAAKYGAKLDVPPPRRVELRHEQAVVVGADEDAVSHGGLTAVSMVVPDDYMVEEAVVGKNPKWWGYDEDERELKFLGDPARWIDKSGTLTFVYSHKYITTFHVRIAVTAVLRPEVGAQWRLDCWEKLNDAAQARYDENRQFLKQRLSTLTEEVGGDDALSLRKIEREEVMKGVLRWIFGPDFAFIPPGLGNLYEGDASVKNKDVWSKMLAHGEMITFLHQAIEWENVLYFLYPYFWSKPGDSWEFKKYLDHPDPMHRAFLRSGSARVVLTIRPGFEKDFVTYLVSFLETGKPGMIPTDHPYMKITEEMEAYAKTNYPGIPPANPEGVDGAEEGALVGSWNEYTPTSALDIAFDEMLPSA